MDNKEYTAQIHYHYAKSCLMLRKTRQFLRAAEMLVRQDTSMDYTKKLYQLLRP
jgi:hypothetical protein